MFFESLYVQCLIKGVGVLLLRLYMFCTNYPMFDRVAAHVMRHVHVLPPPPTEAILGHLERSLVIMDLAAFVDRWCHEFFHLS